MVSEHTGSVIHYDRLICSSSVDAIPKNNDYKDLRFANIATVPFKPIENEYRVIDNDTIAIQLNRGLEAIVDSCLYDRIKEYRWIYCETRQWKKVNRFIRGDVMDSEGKKVKSLLLDRFLIGCTDQTILVRHKNGDLLDCRIANLVMYMRKKNLQNQQKTA